MVIIGTTDRLSDACVSGRSAEQIFSSRLSQDLVTATAHYVSEKISNATTSAALTEQFGMRMKARRMYPRKHLLFLMC